MSSADDISPVSDSCEICGAALSDEVVIQEFADGSLARLCPECAAGANLEGGEKAVHEREKHTTRGHSIWPDEQDPVSASASIEFDPLEKTRELLLPVTDLIGLQSEMQAALERLATSLESFAAEMITDSQSKTAAENRLQMLELELDNTRSKLLETESLLAAATPGGTKSTQPADTMLAVETPSVTAPTSLPKVKPLVDVSNSGSAAAEIAEVSPQSSPEVEATETSEPTPPVEPVSEVVRASGVEPSSEAESIPETEPAAPSPPVQPTAPPLRPTPAEAVAPETPAEETPAEERSESGPDERTERLPTFRIDEVQAVQRYYNDSPFVNRIRDVLRSLGKPKANLTRLPSTEPSAIVTIAWDIVWYQYLVDLRRDLPSHAIRVTFHREGMDLDELAFYFKEKNAVINDDGRLDASELEVKLLSDPDALITEMSIEERRLLEDATEEVWGQRIAPEFKWDD